jgi:3-phenylpropionate/trans-cinnamate dioxygenase ferredoxin reductase subunit
VGDARTFVIVGASLTGAKAAETLRKEGFDGRVVLVGEEPVRPYERPPLSKEYLRGEAGPDKLHVHADGYYEAQSIELRLSSPARSVDLMGRQVVMAGDERIRFDSLLLCTGARPRRLRVPGAGLEGVFYLRDMADSDRLREAVKAASRVIVIGAGWIGCEVAASARQMGTEVAMVEVANLPLERALGPELGRFYRDVHAAHGVEMHFGAGVEEILGEKAVEGARLSNGKTLRGEVVVVGIGVEPRVELAEEAGLALSNGVLTDEFLETSAPGVYAAGDVANVWHPALGRRLRLEHWSAARNQGPAAAKNMLGLQAAYTQVPYFYSDQYDVGMEYSGSATAWDEVVIRGDLAGRAFVAFWLQDGRVAAGMNVNVWDVAGKIANLVSSRRAVDPQALADPDVDLATF